jgi:hypothetical protein
MGLVSHGATQREEDGRPGKTHTLAGGGRRHRPGRGGAERCACAVRAGDLEEGVSYGWGPGYSAGRQGQTRVKIV